MKILSPLLVALLLFACSSDYAPSEKMRAYRNAMTHEQAKNVLQQAIWGADSPGICGSRGFWYDNNSDMQVQDGGIDMLAHKRGKVLRKHEKKIGEVVVFEKQYYGYTFEFDKVDSIVVYDDPVLLPVFPDCNKKDVDANYYIIDLYIDDLNNLKFTVPEQDFDKTMAALSLLLPDKPMQVQHAW